MPTTSTQKHRNVTIHHKGKDYGAWRAAYDAHE